MTTQLATSSQALPQGFVYLQDIDPTILQEVRYAGCHNFVGRPIPGYNASVIIISEAAALALKAVQAELKPFHLTLKVYDAYRPQDAVDSWIKWAEDPSDQLMKAEFYPRVNKKDVFDLGYVGKKSGHTRGSTVDLTIVPLPVPHQPTWKSGDPILDGSLPHGQRFADNSIDMGTGFDYFGEPSHTCNPAFSAQVRVNRLLLVSLMEKYGFENYHREWWHFSLKNEPFPETYFNFPVE
jgi:D-alanyl-D-alanine dipeptidase